MVIILGKRITVFLASLFLAMMVFAYAPADTNYEYTYETAISLAGIDLTNTDNLEKALIMLEQIGSFQLSKMYNRYFQQILEIQSENPDLDKAEVGCQFLAGNEKFTEDLNNRGLPASTELLIYVEGRKHEAAGEYSEAFACYGEITILDAPDRAWELMDKIGPVSSQDQQVEQGSDSAELSVAVSSWKELQQTIDESKGNVRIILSSDIQAGSDDTAIIIPSGAETAIDLNGHSIDRACREARENGTVIRIAENASLTITDETKTGRIIGGNTDGFGGAFYNEGTLVMEGIIIEKNAAFYGGGIYVASGATLRIRDSQLIGNSAESDGGAICSHGIIDITNSTVFDNACGGGGAGIWTDGRANLDAVEIYKNRNALNGGGIASHGILNINNGAIRENSVSGSGGAVFHGNNGRTDFLSSLTMINVTIENNTAQKVGGAIYIDSGTVSLQGNTAVINNETKTGGGTGIFISDGTLSVQDSLKVMDNKHQGRDNDIYLHDGQCITISGQLNRDAHIGIYLYNMKGVFTSGYSRFCSIEPNIVFFDNSGRQVKQINGEASID